MRFLWTLSYPLRQCLEWGHTVMRVSLGRELHSSGSSAALYSEQHRVVARATPAAQRELGRGPASLRSTAARPRLLKTNTASHCGVHLHF